MKVTNIILIGLIILSGALGIFLFQSSNTNSEHGKIVATLEAKIADLEVRQNNLVDENKNLAQTIEDYQQKERRYLEIQQQLNEIAGIASSKNSLTGNTSELDPNSITDNSLNTLEKNQRELKKLRKEKSKLASKINSLKKQLNSSNADKEKIQGQIDQLQAEMNKTDVMIANLQTVIEKHQKTIMAQAEEINTIYYVIGTRNELREKGVTTKEGGVLWGLLGSTEAVRNDFSNENFTAQNLTQSDEIEINAHKSDISIHTKQHKSAYELVEISDDKTILKVKNPEQFRKDKHLVIEID
jgi:chromosome segregation ATPase